MRAVFTAILVLAIVGAVAFVVLTQRGGSEKPHFTVELDNAFGLTEGADLKVAGVRAGTIKKFRLDRETHRALVDFQITESGFGSLRKDVFCESRPQSLIGEYYIDCKPGKSPEKLEDGATIPVEQTASTIPIDLVNNVLRKPYRERLAIILDELGVGVAGRADDINEVVRRASPALRETNKVLEKLARQNQTLKQLITDADTVITDLAGNKRDVVRWAVETKETARISAERRTDIQRGLERLPTFLRELRPTMAALGAAADTNTPALRNLNASADQLATLLRNLKPFTEATQVNLRSLAAASRKGRPAVKAARPLVAELRRGTKGAPQVGNNSAIVLEHLNNRKFAVEKDPRSPGGQGYTGFEAILQWLFDQPMAINTYDKNGYILKVNLFVSKCSDYQNPESLKARMAADPSFYRDCAAILGPNQPGITTPDPTRTGFKYQKPPVPQGSLPPVALPPAPGGGGVPLPPAPGGGGVPLRSPATRERSPVDGVTNGARRETPQAQQTPDAAVPQARNAPSAPKAPNLEGTGATDQLLDYLFAP